MNKISKSLEYNNKATIRTNINICLSFNFIFLLTKNIEKNKK